MSGSWGVADGSRADECAALVKHSGEIGDMSSGKSGEGINIMTVIKALFLMAISVFAIVVWVGARLMKPSDKKKKDKTVQTDTIERMTVSVEELTIESIKLRLREKQLLSSGLKQQLVDRLSTHAQW